MGQKLLTERASSARTISLGLWQEGLTWLRHRWEHKREGTIRASQGQALNKLSPLFWVSIWWGKLCYSCCHKTGGSACGANVIILSCFRLCRVSLLSSVSLQSGYHRTPQCWGGRELGTVKNNKLLLAIQNTVCGHLLFQILLWGLRTQSANQTYLLSV